MQGNELVVKYGGEWEENARAPGFSKVHDLIKSAGEKLKRAHGKGHAKGK